MEKKNNKKVLLIGIISLVLIIFLNHFEFLCVPYIPLLFCVSVCGFW